MLRRGFGESGLEVSALGFGAGHIGDPGMGEGQVEGLLGEALDLGITLIDTARSYGESEARIGRHLGGRRAEFVLSTKVGYGIEGFEDWTGGCVSAGIEAALARLRTDWIDVVHLHSCPLSVLERGDVIEALERARERGQIRVAAYSGEGEALDWAVGCGAFGGVQLSVNVCDQGAMGGLLGRAGAAGVGVIAKRPLANAPWRFAARPEADDLAIYWERFEALGLDRGGEAWGEVALRFSAFAPGVCSAIVGTSSRSRLAMHARAVEAGALEVEAVEAIRAAWRAAGGGWAGVI